MNDTSCSDSAAALTCCSSLNLPPAGRQSWQDRVAKIAMPLLTGLAFTFAGCTGDPAGDADAESKKPPFAASEDGSDADIPDVPPIAENAGDANPGDLDGIPRSTNPPAGAGATRPVVPVIETLPMVSGAAASSDAIRKLRTDFTPYELTQYLAGADADMRSVFHGANAILDPAKRQETLKRLIDAKLMASQQLAKHPEASEDEKITGLRGELQSMSHLATIGNVDAAIKLEKMATEFAKHPNPKLSFDSSLILIGFAIEGVIQGKDDANTNLVGHIDSFIDAQPVPDIPALMVIGNARDILAGNGHADDAEHVRSAILTAYGQSSNPEIAKIVAKIAGNAKSDRFNTMLRGLLDQQDVPTSDFTVALDELVAEAPDIMTVGYLAGAAVELEGLGKIPHAEIIYETLRTGFDDNGPAKREAEITITARENRTQIIGKPFAPDFDTIRGEALSMEDYRGKVVLIPFWSIAFPASLQMVPELKTIRDGSPDQIAIVGMNLDAGDPAQMVQFQQSQGLDFPSFDTIDSGNAQNVAKSFGLVSMPFLAIVDTEGKIAAINLTGRDLKTIIKRLLPQSE